MTTDLVADLRHDDGCSPRTDVELRRLAADEIERLRAAAYQACSDMGCFCPDEELLNTNNKCVMCKLEAALHG